jgi:uncharacterized OB-fold protein
MLAKSSVSSWRLYKERYLLQGGKCSKCKRLFYPKVHLCLCGCREILKINFSGKGILKSYTQVMSPSWEFKSQGAVFVGLIELIEGILIIGQLSDTTGQITIGTKVMAVLRKIYTMGKEDIINYGLVFIPDI